ncbi:MAG: hypothetical protein P8046_10675 [Anaerolineales bacterium]
MGVILMKREFGFRHKGIGYGTDILYVYCDDCGSFSIKTYWGVRKIVTIIATCIYVFFFIKIISGFLNLILFFAISVILLKWLFEKCWGDKDYACRKCGNKDIIVNHPMDYASVIHQYNTLNYPANMGIIDVPEKLTQKRYQGYWDDEYR